MKFVILAAGIGSRVGRVGSNLHKSLLPLDGRAILSHQLELAPSHADIIIIVGNRSTQVRDYVRLAHPSMAQKISFVEVKRWFGPYSGPGASLMHAKTHVGDDDMVYVTCDTLWTRDDRIWHTDHSWVAVAPVPSGSDRAQWCRFAVRRGVVTEMIDKSPSDVRADAFTGLALIKSADLPTFWSDILQSMTDFNEARDVAGYATLIRNGTLRATHIEWTDTGTEAAYKNAVARYSGYDWTKPDQATYVLPDEARVVKFMADDICIERRHARGMQLASAVPTCIARTTNLLAYKFIAGNSVYQALAMHNNDISITERLLEWYNTHFTKSVSEYDTDDHTSVANYFYRVKTHNRISLLSPLLSHQAHDAIMGIDWDKIAEGCIPVHGHGDFNFGNILYTDDGVFKGIDWREDFGGVPWIDARYDLAKLLAGTVIHWDNARRGDFRPWSEGSAHNQCICEFIQMKYPDDVKSIKIIAALSLLNSAPLHASPLDEILVARATFWLRQIL